jgi:hypothetical protein
MTSRVQQKKMLLSIFFNPIVFFCLLSDTSLVLLV